MNYSAGEARVTAYENLAMALPERPEMAEATVDMFRALSMYLTEGQYAHGGDIAMRYHAMRKSLDYPYRFQDRIELSVPNLAIVDTNVSADFFIAHHHLGGDDGIGANLTVVHKEIGLTASITATPPNRGIIDTWLHDLEVPLSSPETMLADTVRKLQRISLGLPVEPRLFSEAHLLNRLKYDPDAAEAAWQALRPIGRPTLAATYSQAQTDAMDRTDLLVTGSTFARPASLECDHCVDSTFFPLSQPGDIYRFWGIQ